MSVPEVVSVAIHVQRVLCRAQAQGVVLTAEQQALLDGACKAVARYLEQPAPPAVPPAVIPNAPNKAADLKRKLNDAIGRQVQPGHKPATPPGDCL